MRPGKEFEICTPNILNAGTSGVEPKTCYRYVYTEYNLKKIKLAAKAHEK
jgi:hypothetical protein